MLSYCSVQSIIQCLCRSHLTGIRTFRTWTSVIPIYLLPCPATANLKYSIKKTSLLVRFCSDKNHNMPPKKSKNKSVADPKVVLIKTPIKTDKDQNVVIDVYAKPGAKQNAIVDVSDDAINIQINAPPVEGSANTELVKYIAAFLGVKSSCVSLERGHKSRNKVLKISGNITRIDIVRKFNAELPDQSKIPEDG